MISLQTTYLAKVEAESSNLFTRSILNPFQNWFTEILARNSLVRNSHIITGTSQEPAEVSVQNPCIFYNDTS